jgi:hypothetical protein
MHEQKSIRPLLFAVAGLAIWASHFGAIYAINALACARGAGDANLWGFPAVPAAVTVTTLVAIAALIALAIAVRSGRHPEFPEGAAPRTERFLNQISLTVAGIATLGVVWDALPAYIVPSCG